MDATGPSPHNGATETHAVGELISHFGSAEATLVDVLRRFGLSNAGPTLSMWAASAQGDRAYASLALLHILGESEALQLASCEQFFARVHPEDRDSFRALFAGTSDPSAPSVTRHFSTLLRVRAADGTWRYLSCTGVKLLPPSREPLALSWQLVMTCEDHTEAHISRIELSYARDFGEKVVRSTVNGILGFDKKLNIIEFNPALEEMFGVARVQAVGRNVFDVMPFLRESHEDCFYYDTLAGKKQASYDRPYARLDNGAPGYFRANYIPLVDSDQDVSGGLVVIAETTFDRQNQKLQNILLEASTQLAQLNEPRVVLDVLLNLAVPGLCDWSVVYLHKDQHFAVRHRDGAATEQLRALLAAGAAPVRDFLCTPPERAERGHSATETVENVPPSLFRLIGRHAEVGEVLTAVGLTSYFRVALTSQGDTLGTMTFCTSQEPMSERRRAVSELVALRGALALANAQLIKRSRAAESALLRIEREVLAPLQSAAPSPRLNEMIGHLGGLLLHAGR